MQSRVRELLQANYNSVKVGDWEDSYTLSPPAVDHIFRAVPKELPRTIL